MSRVALVAGAGGIIGKALLEEIARTPGWRGLALSRQGGDVSADLTDGEATRSALQAAREATHLFYAAYKPGGGLAEEDRINSAMLRHLLDGLKAVGAPLERVVLYQGAKVYGVHLGPVSSPFYEDDNPRPIGPNFYFTQEDELRRRGDAGGPGWTILRPDVVLGDAAGNAMNIATVIGAYAALTKADGAAFRFPGSAQVYDHCLAQFTDAPALARASLWAATADAAKGEAFNYVHAPFRWRRVWEKVAAHFGLETGEPIPFSLAEHMPCAGAGVAAHRRGPRPAGLHQGGRLGLRRLRVRLGLRRSVRHDEDPGRRLRRGARSGRCPDRRDRAANCRADPAAPVRVCGCAWVCGGGGGIRTHGTLASTTVFETATIGHSVTPPQGRAL